MGSARTQELCALACAVLRAGGVVELGVSADLAGESSDSQCAVLRANAAILSSAAHVEGLRQFSAIICENDAFLVLVQWCREDFGGLRSDEVPQLRLTGLQAHECHERDRAEGA